MRRTLNRTLGWLSLVGIGLGACASDAPDSGAELPPAAGPSIDVPVGIPTAGSGVATIPPSVAGDSPIGSPAAGSSAGSAPAAIGGTGSVPVVAPGANPEAAGGATYHRDIRPLLEARCVGCHVDDGAGPFPLDTWASVDEWKAGIVPAVQARRMPPWTADDADCTKLRDSQRLTDAQLALFESWRAGGFAIGNEADFKPIVERPRPVLGEPTRIVKATQPYQLRSGYEEYQCLRTDGDITEDTWVTALDVVPENPQYVHHAIVSVGSGNCDALGTTAENIYSYRPGSRTVVFEPGDALLLRGGNTIAIEFHYNTRFAPAGMTPPTDQSPLRLWTLPKGQKPERAVVRMPNHNFSINIPVNAVDQKVSSSGTRITGDYARAGSEIIGMSPHMHYLGQSFNETLHTADGKTTCLVDIPDWDQSWQLDYMFEPSEYIKVESGVSLSQECVFSNRPEDQGIGPDGVRFTPEHTTFGEETRREMCLGYVWFRYPL